MIRDEVAIALAAGALMARRASSAYGGYAAGLRQPVRDLARWPRSTWCSSVLFPPPLVGLRSRAIELVAGRRRSGSRSSASLQRILAGFVAGSLIGIPIGLAIGSFSIVRHLLEPYTEFLRFIPAVAHDHRRGDLVRHRRGLEDLPDHLHDDLHRHHQHRRRRRRRRAQQDPRRAVARRHAGQLFFLVALPATVPYILTGMRLAMANSFTTIVAAELVAANDGLGMMLWDGRMFMLVDEIFVALVALGLLGFAADRLFRWGIYAFAGRLLAGDLTRRGGMRMKDFACALGRRWRRAARGLRSPRGRSRPR